MLQLSCEEGNKSLIIATSAHVYSAFEGTSTRKYIYKSSF